MKHIIFFMCFIAIHCYSKETLINPKEYLDSLSLVEIPKLNETISISISGLSLNQTFQSIARISELNINVSPLPVELIYTQFSNEKVKDILSFLCVNYNLEIENFGGILKIEKSQNDLEIGNKSEVIYKAYNNLISIESNEDQLWNLLKLLIDKTGKNIICDENIKDRLVSVYLKNIELENALKVIAESNNLILKRRGEGSPYMFSAMSNQSLEQNSELFRDNFAYSDDLKIQQNELFPELISGSFRNKNSAFILDEISNQFSKNYIFLDQPDFQVNLSVENIGHDDFLDLLFKNSKFRYKKDDDVYLIAEKSNSSIFDSKLYQFKFRTAELILNVIPTYLKSELEITFYKELNGILIHGHHDDIKRLTAFFDSIDQIVPMVQIELIIVDFKKGKTISTGISAGVSDSVKSGGSLFPILDFTLNSKDLNNASEYLSQNKFINLGKVNPNFYTSLKALEEHDNIDIRSTPRLATLNSHEANLTIGRTEYYLEQTQNIQGSNNLITTVTPQYKEINADLSITILPTVSANEHITLDIKVELADFTDPLVVNGPPGKAKRKFNSLIRIKNEEMIVLGGLEEESKSKSSSGVPFLSRIPILKWIFSARDENKSHTKLLIFVKPSIIY